MRPFEEVFKALTGYVPFPWQRRLYEHLVAGNAPARCNLPTGLGKTSIIHIWLIALAAAPTRVPRRLVYVVNRRTVVDQATREVERLRENLGKVPALEKQLKGLCAVEADPPLAISTLRGQFADNGEWHSDPTRPAVIVGTVDMIGSRLLFGGYGCGFKTRPLHAGFLAQDSLLVHDEAHLEPAFQTLLEAIREEQAQRKDIRPLRVTELTATSRGNDNGGGLGLTEEDCCHKMVQQRLEAKKGIAFHAANDERETADRVAELALKYKDSKQAILVYLRKLDDVEKVAQKLKQQQVQRLTGTLRGLERDQLAREDPGFARFLPQSDRSAGVTPAPGTAYLLCTSAGEVGVNLSADHLVCDLTPLDSMVQRFGRVNRFGDGDARIDVVHEKRPGKNGEKDNESDKASGKERYEQARWKTLEVLRKLPRIGVLHDASPKALGELPAEARQAAFTPPPVILPTSDILFDAWALTTIRQPLPGRPPVADWLHGVREWEPPETYVVWRQEVERITGALLEEHPPEDLLDDYPLKPHELLRDRTDRVFKDLEALATRSPDTPVWVVELDNQVRPLTFGKLIEKDRQGKPRVNLNGCTVILPPGAGGLKIVGGESKGLLDGGAQFDEAHRALYDIADEWHDESGGQRRQRVWGDQPRPAGMRLVRTIRFDNDAEGAETRIDESPAPRIWRWYVRPRAADEAGSWSSTAEQELLPHLDCAEATATRIVTALRLLEPLQAAVVLAARHHDRGKDRGLWQKGIGNNRYPNIVLAKSDRSRPPLNRHYRHEFGSLMDLASDAKFQKLSPEMQDLVLHLIAAHHGRARPHFPAEEAFDPERPESSAADAAREVPRRFARLQRAFGRWGLAYLESLLRVADALASQPAETVAKARQNKGGAR